MRPVVNEMLRRLWSVRRWLYGAYVLFAITRIPARVGFRSAPAACDMRLTYENIGLSLTKVPHIVLFGAFFLLTAAQFDRIDQRALWWSVLATGAFGLLIELEEGATRTGNCRLTDVLPDLLGALIGAALLMTVAMILDRSHTHGAAS